MPAEGDFASAVNAMPALFLKTRQATPKPSQQPKLSYGPLLNEADELKWPWLICI
jgi:hypothetical protein